jgi:hypothetical protein
MKRICGVVLLLALFSLPALAAKNTQTLNFSAPVTVGSTQLTAGDYKVSWTGSGSSVQVTLARGGKTVATVPAKLVEEKDSVNGITTSTQGGVGYLQVIRVGNISLILQSTQISGQ